jgi:hypothetical protein
MGSVKSDVVRNQENENYRNVYFSMVGFGEKGSQE